MTRTGQGPHERPRPSRPYPPMPVLRCEIVGARELPTSRPDEGWAVLYELAASRDGPAFHIGQTRQAPADRLARHCSLARVRARKPRGLEVRIRRLAEAGQTLFLRVVDLLPAGQAADDAEREWAGRARVQTVRDRADRAGAAR
jgi:hypothetical protein